MATILIVDDDKTTRIALRGILEQAGYTVLEVTDGIYVRDKLHRDKPDLLITDIIMPGQEGMETIEQVRDEYPELPIIAISTGGRERYDYVAIATRLGANEGLHKPIDAGELLPLVERLLAKAKG